MDPNQFYATYIPYARSVSERTGLDPRLVLAQAALETGYGRSAPNKNFFGIKSHGRSGGEQLMTSEFESGRMVRKPQSFRGYSDPAESFEDYATFLLENPRYEDVLDAPDLNSQIAAMGESGYATDPNYAVKLSQIASRFPEYEMTYEARRARYGLGDRDPGTTAQVLEAVQSGDMTKSEAARYVSEDLLEGVAPEEKPTFMESLGEAAAYLNASGIGQAPSMPDKMLTSIDRGQQGVGSQALSRMGIGSLA